MPVNVIDKYNRSYNIAKRLGEGSQGETFLLEGETHIVKLFKKTLNETE